MSDDNTRNELDVAAGHIDVPKPHTHSCLQLPGYPTCSKSSGEASRVPLHLGYFVHPKK